MIVSLRKGKIENISFSIEGVLEPLIEAKGTEIAKIIYHWDNIIPKKFLNSISPIKIQKSNNKKVLVLQLDIQSFAIEIMMNESIILEKANMYLGGNKIAKIKLLNSISKK